MVEAGIDGAPVTGVLRGGSGVMGAGVVGAGAVGPGAVGVGAELGVGGEGVVLAVWAAAGRGPRTAPDVRANNVAIAKPTAVRRRDDRGGGKAINLEVLDVGDR